MSLLEQRFHELGRSAPIRPDHLINVADNLPMGHLADAVPNEWSAVLEQASHTYRQVERTQERRLGLSR